MPELSVIIPGRQERWFLQTVESIRAAVRGDTEIIAVVDGEEAEPKLPAQWPDDGGPPVRIIRHPQALGQRPAINAGVKASAAKFILKTDAHSMMDEGFDIKLMADCEYDWTVIPSMHNLHSHDMVCIHCGAKFYNAPEMSKCPTCLSTKVGGSPAMHREMVWKCNTRKPPTNWMWFRSPDVKEMPLRVQYWDAPTARAFPAEYKAHREWAKRQGDIADVMTGQGACWFLHRERFWELGGLDEAHGHWGQMGVEVALKTWLSGGRQVVNRKTWFAHLFRCGGSEGCPWPMSGRQQEQTRQYSIDFWTHNRWPLQKRPLEWLIEKFWPVPTWKKPETVPELRDYHVPGEPASTRTLSILYYTDNSLPESFARSVRDILRASAGDVPILWVSQQPLADVPPKDNVVVGPLPRERSSIYRQIIAGLKRVKTDSVALCEHDILYPTGYFEQAPRTPGLRYNRHQYYLHVDKGPVFGRRRGQGLSQLTADKELLNKELRARLKGGEKLLHEKRSFEPGKANEKYGLPPADVADWMSALPTVDVNGHGYNLSVPRPLKGEPLSLLKPWGDAKELRDRLLGSEIVPKPVAKLQQTAKQMAKELRDSNPPVMGKRRPDISVLIPARNEPFLPMTIRGLLKNLKLDFEILVGLDGPEQKLEGINDPRVRIFQNKEAMGMRPTLNRLLHNAKGRFILKCDAHVAIGPGMDAELVKVWEPGGAVVARRYDLDTKRWRKREHSKTDWRRLTHVSEDGIGLRSMAWPEYAEAHANDPVSETMTCSGSCYLIERELWAHWGGWDERHGHFGQEGAEMACKVWLSGGRLLHTTRSWYAHHNRGKATYSMGAGVKPQSIRHSHDLWLNDKWPFQKYSFNWLLEKFQPPGWPAPDYGPVVKGIRHGNNCKSFRVSVQTLWEGRHNISEPLKAHRLDIFWKAFPPFVDSVLAGQPDWDGPYYHYLVSHLRRGIVRIPNEAERGRVRRKMENAEKLVKDMQAHGLRSPLEFYNEDGRMILWKGYRRLVILRQLGNVNTKRAIGRSFVDKRAAASLSPEAHLRRLQPPPPGKIQRLAERQYRSEGGNATDKYWVHNYVRYYDVHFPELRRRAHKVCELGLAKGASLRLWRDYFPRAEIIGFDREPERWKLFAGGLPRVRVIVGDETDPADLKRLARHGPFDIIIDDASHIAQHQRAAWEALWPHVQPFGWYVIEDIYQSFAPEPTGRCVPEGLEAGIFTGRDIRQIHWYYNIVFIQKAP